jgi:fermentation-respiration switch protein FrsA (DUF1100 family)
MYHWRRAAISLFGIYALTALGLVVFEDRLAFPGWTLRKPWAGPPARTVIEDVTIAATDGNRIEAWWLPSPRWTPPQGAIIYLHGNGEDLPACARTLIKWRNELHMGVLGFDYPGFGRSTGKPGEQSCAAAAEACFDWLVREKKIAPEEIIVVGQSMGGAVATELVCQRPCRLLVTSGAFTSFPDVAQYRFFWMPARYLVCLRFDNLGKMKTMKTPVFIAHGTDDHVVPFSHGERLFEAAPRGSKRFYPILGHGHSHPKSAGFYEAVRQFLGEMKTAKGGG